MKDVFERIADSWMSDLFRTGRGDLPEILYHYTDAAGLVGILETGEVWATDSRFLNDKEELRHFRSAAKRLIQRVSLASADADEIALYTQIVGWQGIPNPDSFFVFSLTSEGDDLSQWRGYSQNGRGYSIGFRAADLYARASTASSNFGFSRVEYDHDKQTRAIETALSDVSKTLRKQLRNHAADREKLLESASYNFDNIVEVRAALNKHKSFKDEREWRLAAIIDHDNPQHEVKLRVKNGQIVPYVSLNLKEKGSKMLPIVEIRIGPGFEGSEHEKALGILMRKLNYNFKIDYAQTPYRSG